MCALVVMSTHNISGNTEMGGSDIHGLVSVLFPSIYIYMYIYIYATILIFLFM